MKLSTEFNSSCSILLGKIYTFRIVLRWNLLQIVFNQNNHWCYFNVEVIWKGLSNENPTCLFHTQPFSSSSCYSHLIEELFTYAIKEISMRLEGLRRILFDILLPTWKSYLLVVLLAPHPTTACPCSTFSPYSTSSSYCHSN